MAKAALSLNELSELWIPEMNSIDLIEQDQRMILHAKTDVERNADGMLNRGMESQNQNQIAIAVQVFQNLSILEPKLVKSLDQHLSQVKKKLLEATDVKKITASVEETNRAKSGSTASTGGGPGKAAMPAPGNMATFRAILWNNIESVLDFIYNKTLEIISLQKVLQKKRDAVSHVSFVELLAENKRQVKNV